LSLLLNAVKDVKFLVWNRIPIGFRSIGSFI
jgi:hypothetical protein